MSNPIKKEEALNSLIIGLISTIIPSILFSVYDGLIVTILLYLIFKLFLRKNDNLLFTYCYGILLINSTIFLLIVNYVYGGPFLTGGDDFLFYNAGKELHSSNYDINIEVDGIPLWVSNYPFYLFLISFYYEFLSFFRLNSLSFYHFTLFKISLGAIVPILMYRISEIVNFRFTKATLLLILFFPTLVYHTTSFLRESIISFFFIIGIFVILFTRQRFHKILFIILLCLIIYFIRPVHSFFLFSFFTLYHIIKSKSHFYIKFAIIFFLIISGFIILNLKDSNLLLQYQNTRSSYLELSELTAANGSLGVKLYGSNNKLLEPFKYFYYLMSPIPPPIFGGLNILTIYITIGSIIWYLIVLSFIKSVFRIENRINPYFLTLFIIFLISVVVGTNTTKDPRHLIYIYPLIIPFGLRELKMTSKLLLFVTISLFFIIGSLGYFMLKFSS